MTRKEELEARARDYVSLFVMSGAEPAATKYLTRMLQQVEREVWEKSVKHFKTITMLYGNDSWRERSAVEACAEWCERSKRSLDDE